MPRKFMDSARLFAHGKSSPYDAAECYRLGHYVEQDMDVALEYYHAAERLGDARAHVRLGEHHERNERIQQALNAYLEAAIRSDKTAKRHLMRLAGTGNMMAEYYLGVICERQEEWETAREHYLRAAERESLDAMYCLGKLYQTNRQFKHRSHITVIHKDERTSLNWYRRAASAGYARALHELLELSKSIPQAAIHIAQMYEHGEGGLAKNRERMLEFYEKASALNDDESTFHLARLYEQTGEKQKAISFYITAIRREYSPAKERLIAWAESGDPDAQYAMGASVEHVKKNYHTAVQWCIKAAYQGYEEALTYLTKTKFSTAFCLEQAKLYEHKSGYMRFAFLFYKKLSDMGDSHITLLLGQLYQIDHKDIEHNYEEAFKYYLQAVKRGRFEALPSLECLGIDVSAAMQFELGNLYLLAEFKDERRALAWYEKASKKGCAGARQKLSDLKRTDGRRTFISLDRFSDTAGLFSPRSTLFSREKASGAKQLEVLAKALKP